MFVCVSLVLEGEEANKMCDEVNYCGFESYSAGMVFIVDDDDVCVTGGVIFVFLGMIVNFN